jgi:hypothetical protein
MEVTSSIIVFDLIARRFQRFLRKWQRASIILPAARAQQLSSKRGNGQFEFLPLLSRSRTFKLMTHYPNS